MEGLVHLIHERVSYKGECPISQQTDDIRGGSEAKPWISVMFVPQRGKDVELVLVGPTGVGVVEDASASAAGAKAARRHSLRGVVARLTYPLERLDLKILIHGRQAGIVHRSILEIVENRCLGWWAILPNHGYAELEVLMEQLVVGYDEHRSAHQEHQCDGEHLATLGKPTVAWARHLQ
jgi:hypothetical protein